jgi:hypothetical protein
MFIRVLPYTWNNTPPPAASGPSGPGRPHRGRERLRDAPLRGRSAMRHAPSGRFPDAVMRAQLGNIAWVRIDAGKDAFEDRWHGGGSHRQIVREALLLRTAEPVKRARRMPCDQGARQGEGLPDPRRGASERRRRTGLPREVGRPLLSETGSITAAISALMHRSTTW